MILDFIFIFYLITKFNFFLVLQKISNLEKLLVNLGENGKETKSFTTVKFTDDDKPVSRTEMNRSQTKSHFSLKFLEEVFITR